jgi:hypothetical protein
LLQFGQRLFEAERLHCIALLGQTKSPQNRAGV